MLYGLDTENGEFVASQDIDGGWIITKVNPTFGHHLLFPHRLNTQRVNHQLSAFLLTWSSLLPWPFQDVMSNSMPATAPFCAAGTTLPSRRGPVSSCRMG
jgi:hypothetical protein